MAKRLFSLIPVALSVAMAVNAAHAATKSNEEEDSVYRWGRWEVLAPAAGEQFAPQIPQQLSQFDPEDYEKQFREVDEPSVVDPEQPEPEQPIPVFGLCDAGTACGFSTRNTGSAEPPTTGQGTALNTFNLNITPDGEDEDSLPDAYQYVLNQGEQDELASSVMDDVTGRRIRQATSDDDLSGIVLSIFDDPARGYWDHGDETGYFVHATALSEEVLAGLDGVGLFQGDMWGNQNVFADIMVDFGDSTWSGDWSGDHNFGAAGVVAGPNLVTQTLTNAEGFVGGFLGGSESDKVLVIGVDVITNGVQYTDVGLIREAVQDF